VEAWVRGEVEKEEAMTEDRTSTDRTGPWVVMATFCEKLLTETDGVVTPIRPIDRIIHTVQVVPNQPLAPVQIQLPLMIVLKADRAVGSQMLELRPEKPSGVKMAPQSFSILMEGADRGSALVINPLTLQTDEEGLYWFDVRYAGELLTRIPLRLVLQRIQTMGPSVPSSQRP